MEISENNKYTRPSNNFLHFCWWSIFIARKRSWRQAYAFTGVCLPQGEGVSLTETPRAETPWTETPLLDRDPRAVTSRCYASDWNDFLFQFWNSSALWKLHWNKYARSGLIVQHISARKSLQLWISGKLEYLSMWFWSKTILFFEQ